MSVDVESAEAVSLKQKIDDQGTTVRSLKTAGGEKTEVDAAVKLLLKLKTDYKELTGVDLAGGGSGKKGKKEKKAAKEPQPKETPQPKKAKQAPVKREQAPVKQEQPSEPKATPGKQEEAKDMSMAAVLARLAQRSTQADQIVATLRTQISSLRQSAALTACRAEEERLKTENDSLKLQVEQLKSRLVHVEVRNGVPQVPLPTKSSTVTPATTAQPTPVQQQKDQSKPTEGKQQKKEAASKKEKKENKPKTGQQKGGNENTVVDISRIDMRIGKIVGVKQHPDADSLYLEEVDVGEGKNRTVLSGLVKHVPIEQMQDRVAIFMCNLKPAKMRGIFSEGMIMCGSTPEKVEIVVPPPGAKVGDKLYVDGYEGTPDEQLNPKKKIFEQVQPDLRISTEGVATYKGVAWKVRGVDGLCTVPTMRDTPIK